MVATRTQTRNQEFDAAIEQVQIDIPSFEDEDGVEYSIEFDHDAAAEEENFSKTMKCRGRRMVVVILTMWFPFRWRTYSLLWIFTNPVLYDVKLHSQPSFDYLFRIFNRRGDVGRSFNRFQVSPVMSVVPPTAKLKVLIVRWLWWRDVLDDVESGCGFGPGWQYSCACFSRLRSRFPSLCS